MPKILPTVLDDPAPRRRRHLRTALVIALGLALAPVFYETGLLCAAGWKGMYGMSASVETPTIDALGRHLEVLSNDTSRSISGFFQNLPWSPYVVVLIGFTIAFSGCLLLRSQYH